MLILITLNNTALGVLMLVISIVGIVGNICGIIVFGKPRSSQRNFYSFMFYLAIFDLVYILTGFVLFILPHFSHAYMNEGPWYYIVPWAIPIGQISLTCSVYFTTMITIERYLTVCHPFYMISRNLSSTPVSAGIILFATLYNLPKFFETSTTYELCRANQTYMNDISEVIFSSENCEYHFQIQKILNFLTFKVDSNDSARDLAEFKNRSFSMDRYEIQASSLRFNSLYVQVYTIYSNFIVNGVTPFMFVIILNVLIVVDLQRIEVDLSSEGHELGKLHIHFMSFDKYNYIIYKFYLLKNYGLFKEF